MIIRSLVVGPLQANCFIIGDEQSKKGMVVDAGDEPDRIMEIVDSEGLTLDYIICTHAHFDHVGAVPD
jgi:glyoxylase-like metal-dependent hydrolase (beta-lactamase superfamily II)